MRSAAVLTVIALALGSVGCGREGRHDVKLSFEQIASIAAEGSLLAGDVARDRTKVTFVRVHGEELSAQAEHEAEKLNDAPVDPRLKARIQVAIKLAGNIGSAIDDLRVSPQDVQQARQSELKLRHFAAVARKLADST
jgi:hypothetical protein